MWWKVRSAGDWAKPLNPRSKIFESSQHLRASHSRGWITPLVFPVSGVVAVPSHPSVMEDKHPWSSHRATLPLCLGFHFCHILRVTFWALPACPLHNRCFQLQWILAIGIQTFPISRWYQWQRHQLIMALYPPPPFHALSQKNYRVRIVFVLFPSHLSLLTWLQLSSFLPSPLKQLLWRSRLPLYCQIQWGLAIWIFLDLSVNLDTVGSAFVTHFVFLISVIPCTWLFFYSSGFHIDFPFPSPFSLLLECLTAVIGSVFFLISILRWPPHQLLLL